MNKQTFMCYKYATPTLDDLLAYLSEQPDYTITDYAEHHPIYMADGFTRPYMAVTPMQNPKLITQMQWGLLPFWVEVKKEREKYLKGEAAKFEKKGKPFDATLVRMPEDDKLLSMFQANTLNAKAEEVFNKPSWTPYIMKSRCIIYASGFYESRHFDDGKVKIPYFIYPADKTILQFGGMWAEWTNKETGEVRNTFAIITTPANTLMSKIHNSKFRMPLIFSKEQAANWLSPELTKEQVIEAMQPCNDALLAAHPVSRKINQQLALEEKNIPAIQDKEEYPDWIKD